MAEINLPPAGDERREVLRQRADALEEQAETSGVEGGAIRPDAFEIDNEIAQYFDELNVPNGDPNFRYCWVQCGASWHGRFINMKRAQGWVIVHASDADAPEDTAQADNTCRVGDVLLMRIRADRYILLKRQAEARQKAMETGITAELEDIGRRYQNLAKGGSLVDTNPSPQRMKRMQAAAISNQQFDRMVREGRVPGAPAPR